MHVQVSRSYNENYDLPESGIYTCLMSDSRGQIQEHMIGLYPACFKSELCHYTKIKLSYCHQLYHAGYPYVYNMYTNQSDQVLTIICQTRDAPPTNLYWHWNGTLIDIDGDTYKVSQRVTNFTSSSYDNILTITKSERMVGTYYCNVSNNHRASQSSIISLSGIMHSLIYTEGVERIVPTP